MELDQLRYFLQVAVRGNFTRASEDLKISQSALSRSIQKLEEELDRCRHAAASTGTAGGFYPRRHEGRDCR